MYRWTAGDSDRGLRLSAFLRKRLPELSGRKVKTLVEQGFCEINGLAERHTSRRIEKGMSVVFKSTDIPSHKMERLQADPERVLYEDKHLLIYDKPPGICCDAEGMIALLAPLANSLTLVHRLDKDTTGVMALAKTVEAQEGMEQLFRERSVTKTYWALVDGIPQEPQGTIDFGIATHRGDTTSRHAVDPGKGQASLTHYHVEAIGSRAALVECQPETGRTHQIRIHLSAIGHPILGDMRYGRRFRCRYPAARYLLHAHQLAFAHPVTGVQIDTVSPLPADMQKACVELGIEQEGR